jgi:transcription initiation factor TFIIIB Brf1 subunit/transcription initiation factor TFIIB
MNCPICKKEMVTIDSPPAYQCFDCGFVAIENEIVFKTQNRRTLTLPVGAKVLSTLYPPPGINPAIGSDD